MNTVLAIVWVLVGMALMGLLVWFTMPSLMLVRHKSKLGWKVLTVNDYQKSTEAFVALERVGSINICNPRYASTILADEKNRGVTAFMPLGLGVYENKKGQVFISQLNVGLLGKMFGGTIANVMGMAGKDIRDLIQSVTGK